MTIITLKQQLSQIFSPDFILRTAKQVGFTRRERAIQPVALVLSLISALSKGNCHAIADLHRQFNGMCLSEKDNVAYKPFHNQLRKPEFAELMQKLVQVAILRFAGQDPRNLPDKLACFDDVLLQDGSSFRVHDELAEIFPSRFQRTPAAIECHLTMSLKTLSPKAMTITADTASERTYLPKPDSLKNKLLLADAGYVDFSYFDAVERQGGAWIVRGLQSLNPTIIEATNGKGHLLPKLAGKKLKEVNRRTSRAEVLDLKVRRGTQVFRVVRRWFKEEKRFCLWVTNLPADKYSADDIMSVYRCRWQVELLFKELKSDTNWRRFATRQKAIVEGVV
ncbi:Transposase DDE domain protein [Vibrio quintilis]|uniref:Transposase DDE domain protein n=1 Tax=Vibrio quintilis TaxID=1117707 RepID=A0A1M7Z2U7_9VIBR|nr:Transposase DDE domain protein [Vibrio quintilis]